MMRTRMMALVCAAAAAGAVSAAQVPSFSSRVESVRVDVLVTEKGKPVLGLGPDDFEVYDNGVIQKVDLASYDEVPLKAILALDMSASLDATALGHLRSAGKTLLNGLEGTDRAALVTFNQVISQGAPLTRDFARVRAALDEAIPFGQTSLVDACFTSLMIGESDSDRSLVIVFSDGLDTTSWLAPQDVLETAKRSDVVVYGVEAGRRRLSFLRDLSGATGGRSIEIESTRDVDAAFTAILEEFRQRYLISFSPQGVAAKGWHRLDVRVKGRNLTVRARPGYLY